MYKIAIVVIIFFLTGCASSGNSIIKNENKNTISTKLTNRITTKDDVRKMFGEPTEINFTDGGLEQWTYIYADISSHPMNFIPIFNLFRQSYSGIKKNLVILFDDNSVIKKYSMNTSPIKTTSGIIK